MSRHLTNQLIINEYYGLRGFCIRNGDVAVLQLTLLTDVLTNFTIFIAKNDPLASLFYCKCVGSIRQWFVKLLIHCIKLETVHCKVYHKEQMTQTTTKQHQAAADFIESVV